MYVAFAALVGFRVYVEVTGVYELRSWGLGFRV